jgi:hypothetical protein
LNGFNWRIKERILNKKNLIIKWFERKFFKISGADN